MEVSLEEGDETLQRGESTGPGASAPLRPPTLGDMHGAVLPLLLEVVLKNLTVASARLAVSNSQSRTRSGARRLEAFLSSSQRVPLCSG